MSTSASPTTRTYNSTSEVGESTSSKSSLKIDSSRRREPIPSSCIRPHPLVRRERYCEGTNHRSSLPLSSYRQCCTWKNCLLVSSHEHQCNLLSSGTLLTRFLLLWGAQDHCFHRWWLHHPIQQYYGYIWISVQQHFRYNVSVEEYVAVQWWWGRLKSILVIDEIKDDDWVHRCSNVIFSFCYGGIFCRRKRSSCGQRLSDKCHRWVLTRYSGLNAFEGPRQAGMYLVCIVAFIFNFIASPEPTRSIYTSALTNNSLYLCLDVNCSVNSF